MKTINSQEIDLKGTGFCQIDRDILTVKGKELECEEKDNIFYIQNSGNNYSNNRLTITGNGNIIGLRDCNVGSISQTIITENGDIFINNTSIKTIP